MQVELALGAAPENAVVYRIAHQRELAGLSRQYFADRTCVQGGVAR